jgi:hypothetical protein
MLTLIGIESARHPLTDPDEVEPVTFHEWTVEPEEARESVEAFFV